MWDKLWMKLTMAVQHLAGEIQYAKRGDASEREKMAMQLQIEFLKLEKRLPTPSRAPDTGEDG
jgi:hypothetical protein